MSAAGIIAHCLSTPPEPPAGTALVWWSAGDGIVQKVQDNSNFASSYSIGGSSVRQGITIDTARNRVFVPTDGTLYIFEGNNAVDPIGVPDEVVIPNIGNQSSQTWNNAISLDAASGQLFLANGSNDSVTIIDSDNSVTTVSGIDQAFYIRAMGSGKFCCISNLETLVVYGPSNAYAAPLISKATPDGAFMSALAYNASSDTIICQLEDEDGGIWKVNGTTGTDTQVSLGGRTGNIMYRVSSTGNLVINDEAVGNGELFVYTDTGSLVCSIDFSGEIAGTLSGAPQDMAHIGNVLCVLQRWTVTGDGKAALHLCNLTTGAILATYELPEISPGLCSKVGVDDIAEVFVATGAGDDLLYAICSFAPYDTYTPFLDDLGSTEVAGIYQDVP